MRKPVFVAETALVFWQDRRPHQRYAGGKKTQQRHPKTQFPAIASTRVTKDNQRSYQPAEMCCAAGRVVRPDKTACRKNREYRDDPVDAIETNFSI